MVDNSTKSRRFRPAVMYTTLRRFQAGPSKLCQAQNVQSVPGTGADAGARGDAAFGNGDTNYTGRDTSCITRIGQRSCRPDDRLFASSVEQGDESGSEPEEAQHQKDPLAGGPGQHDEDDDRGTHNGQERSGGLTLWRATSRRLTTILRMATRRSFGLIGIHCVQPIGRTTTGGRRYPASSNSRRRYVTGHLLPVSNTVLSLGS